MTHRALEETNGLWSLANDHTHVHTQAQLTNSYRVGVLCGGVKPT